MDDNLIAHLREKDKTPQSLWDHLCEASEFAGQFAGKIGLKELGEILGLLHDIGKASQEFQNYICSANGLIDPDGDGYIDTEALKGKVDHSTAGAQIIYRDLTNQGPEGIIAAQVLALCLASHHSGLIDCVSPDGENIFKRRIEKPDEKTHTEEVLSKLYEVEIKLREILTKKIGRQLFEKLSKIKETNDSKETLTFKYGLLIRFLFSCLIDADRLSTADFEYPSNVHIRNYGRYHPWDALINRLDIKIKEFEGRQAKNEVDDVRNQVSQACMASSIKPQGIYQLKVPTGGGKTLASLRFALNHAEHHHLERIFYIIPYTSIIDQNADEVKKILEDKDVTGKYLDQVVLEHHSNLTPEEETRRQNLLSENWDAKIVFTTQVQFLETLFGAGTRSARRMHQLANSVIIFDEVQTIPIRCVHMFNIAIRFLVQSCGSTIVLCTATQPLLEKVEPSQYALTIPPEQRIISNEYELFKKLRRVEVYDRRKVGGWSEDEITDLALQESQNKGSALIIVNTKNAARSLYRAVSDKKNSDVYHLSTNMCPAHRLNILTTIREKLSPSQDLPVICVSTQLIEAGVDIDFGSVIRYVAGLDSIAQAAGRCNRNGRPMPGNVWIVNPSTENIERLKDITIGKENAERVLDEYNDNPDLFENDRLGLNAMELYYKYYFYQRKDEMKYKVGIHSPLGREDDLFNLLAINRLSVAEHVRITNSPPVIPFKQSFQTASKCFYAIDSPTRGVVVPYGEAGDEIVADLCGAADIQKQYTLLKKAQRYSVNLFPHEFEKMANMNAIREVQKESGIFYMDRPYYSDLFGWCDEVVNDRKTLIC
jgi:CRISPR-associated endonuclease/helicase Cas3